MKNLGFLLVLLSLGMFQIGCTKPAADDAGGEAAPAADTEDAHDEDDHEHDEEGEDAAAEEEAPAEEEAAEEEAPAEEGGE